MSLHLAVPFPSETAALQKQARAERHWTATQRMAAAMDALAASEVLSRAGGMREAQLEYQQAQEEEWRRRMKEFIEKHVDR